MCLELPKQQY